MMTEMTKAQRADALRGVWVENGLRTREQMDALTDDEVLEVSIAMLRRFAEVMRPVVVAMQQATVRIAQAFEPVVRHPVVVAEMERRAAERRRA